MRHLLRCSVAALVACVASRLHATAARPGLSGSAAAQAPVPVTAQQPVSAMRAAPAPTPAPLLDSARTALQAGQVEPAIRMAEQYTVHHDRDPKGYVVLGDAYLRRSPAGRFQALHAYEEAVRLAPNDPEAAYLYAQVGIWLGGEEGDAIARRGLEHVLELAPFYGAAWTQWLLVFRNGGSRRQVRDRLERFDSIPEIRARMAYLDVEDELYAIADSALDALLARDSMNAEWLAWRAQSAFEAGDPETGATFYTRALSFAARDSAGALWTQVIGIARPDEIRAWARVNRDQRGAWLASFWARRNPDLFARINGRLAEHFQRLRYARRNYPLLHPLVFLARPRTADAANRGSARGERDGSFERAIFDLLDMDARNLDSAPARIGFSLATGLDERGVRYLRSGVPPGDSAGADDVADLAPDRTSEPAPLAFDVRMTQFAGARPGSTEIAVVTTRGAVAAALWDEFGGAGEVRRAANGLVMLEADPGRYTLLAQARDSGALGRRELGLEARSFMTFPTLSDLLLAPAWASPGPSRWEMLRRAPRTMVFAEGQAMRVYAEVYGLTADGSSVRYRAEYALLRTDNPARDLAREHWEGAVPLGFERVAPAAGQGAPTREVLDISPERLAPGHYLLRLRVRDRVAERDAGGSQIAFEVK